MSIIMNVDDMIGNNKMHSFCLPVESCVVCGDQASGNKIHISVLLYKFYLEKIYIFILFF